MDPGADLLFAIPRGLEQSILLAVLIGFLVTFVLVESFGWVFVGVVIPGYLASVLAIQPAAGLAVLLDSVLTYWVAKLFEQALGRSGASSEFFGRERFFLLVVASVFVRQHTQTWLWALVFEGGSPWLYLSASFQRGFSSIGIVLVPLMANLLWKLDLRRGAWQMAMTTLVTYAVLAWWLLPDTTLSYSALELSYEDTAIDFVGNAKAYIIFLCTAYIASQLNLYYGWDFNGILVPALLGLLWFHPGKLLATVGEAIVVYLVTLRLPRAPLLRSLTIEGPRRLALVFLTSVLLKWIIGWLVGDSLPMLKLNDFYGFGYLLPSLLVVKMTQRKSMRMVLLPTLLASLLGFVSGSLIGFGLSFFDPPPTSPKRRASTPAASTRLLRDPDGVSALGHLHALERADPSAGAPQTLVYARIWESTARWLERPDADRLATLQTELEGSPLELVPVGERDGRAMFALIERDGDPNLGWETALLVPGAPGPVLTVPRPVAEAPLAEAASVLCRRVECRALVVAGADVERDPWLGWSTSSFDVVRNALEDEPMLELHRDPLTGPDPVLHVGAKLPPSIDLRKAWATDVRLDWSSPPIESAGPLPPLGGTLRLDPGDVDALLRSETPPIRRATLPPPWVLQRERDPLVRTRPPSPPPSALEARFLELELVAPLVEVAAGRRPKAELERLGWRAARLGLELWELDDCGDGQPCLGLVDPLGEDGLGWGALLLRRGDVREFAIEVPRPDRAFGTQQLGLELWYQLEARAIYIGPSSDEAHDPMALGNLNAPLMPFHQALDRALGDGSTPPLLLVVLGFGVERMIDADVVIGLGRPALEPWQLPLKLRWALERGPLAWVQAPLLSDGSPLLHALSGQGSPTVEYSLELGNADVALLWFSPTVRERFVRRGVGDEERTVAALGLEYGVIEELDRLRPSADEALVAAPPDAVRAELEELLELASAYRQSRDIHALRRLLAQAAAAPGWRVSVGRGATTNLPVLLIEVQGEGYAVRSLVLLDAATDRRDTLPASDPALRDRIGLSLLQRNGVIEVRSGPPTGDDDRAP